MKNFVILDELLNSDLVIFLIFGTIITFIIGLLVKKSKKKIIATIVLLIVYFGCEILIKIQNHYMMEFLLLFSGIIALGGVIGFGISMLFVRKRKDKGI